jgi:putative ABC transport system permease protein
MSGGPHATVPAHLEGERAVAAPIEGRAGHALRWSTMARVGWRMMFHDKLKLVGTLLGVVFAVVLSNQQAGTFLGLLQKNTMYVDNAGADLWITPLDAPQVQPGRFLTDSELMQARAAPGVAWAEPIIYAGAQISVPGGSNQQISLIGTRAPHFRGGPWNVVSGEREALARPDTMLFEDSERENFGNLNLGSVREVNGRQVRVGGFTWGLIPFGPAFAFAEYDLARMLIGLPADQASFVLVGVAPGADIEAVKAELARRLPEAQVITRQEFSRSTVRYILTKTAIGITFGTSTLFGLIVGFVIVSLSMFSAVVDNIREFGTLKAIGATTSDLARVLFVQSVTYALMGSLVGLAIVSRMAEGIRSAKLAMQTPPQLMGGTVALMVVLCVMASSLALLRLRRVEPAMVFR